jgi:ABC-2 type transport system permease protein
MSTLAVAKKDFQDGIRSRSLQFIVTLFTVFLALLLYYQLYMSPSILLGEFRKSAMIINWVVSQVNILIPILGTMLGYKAIVSERESGSLRFLLGLPHTRRDVMLGKFIGRSAIVVVTVLVGFTVVGIQFAVVSDLFSFSVYALAAGKMAVLGIVFVAIAIAFSTAIRSSMMATWGAIGLAILFTFLWKAVLIVVKSFVRPPIPDTGYGPMPLPPDWFFLLKRLNPRYAFKDASELGLGNNPAPFYLDPWFGGVILAGWLLVPLGIAYLRFQRSDIA